MSLEKFPGFPDPLGIIKDRATLIMALLGAHESFDPFDRTTDQEVEIAELKDFGEAKGFKIPTDEELAIASDELEELKKVTDRGELEIKFKAWLDKYNTI